MISRPCDSVFERHSWLSILCFLLRGPPSPSDIVFEQFLNGKFLKECEKYTTFSSQDLVLFIINLNFVEADG